MPSYRGISYSIKPASSGHTWTIRPKTKKSPTAEGVIGGPRRNAEREAKAAIDRIHNAARAPRIAPLPVTMPRQPPVVAAAPAIAPARTKPTPRRRLKPASKATRKAPKKTSRKGRATKAAAARGTKLRAIAKRRLPARAKGARPKATQRKTSRKPTKKAARRTKARRR